MISFKTASIFVLLAFSISLASADDSRLHEFDHNNIDSLHIDARVGKIIVEPSASGKFEVELQIHEEKKRRWFSRSPDISSMDLKSNQRGTQLRLRFDHEDVKTDWLVRVPELSQIDINLGVGTVELRSIAAGISADVGVGTIDIQTPVETAGMIDLSVGVGETVIKGGSNINSRRALVSSQTSAQGLGDQSIRAEAGVGSIEVILQ